jgi:hypothetical protein
MESHPKFHDYGHFSNDNQAQNGSVYDRLHHGGVSKGWSFEDFHYQAGQNGSHFQPVSVFESENGSAQSSLITDFTSSQSSSHPAFGCGGSNHFNSTWVPHESTVTHNRLPTSDTIAVYTNPRQEIDNSNGTTKFPKATVFVPLYNVQPSQMISPSSIAFQQLCNERVEPPVYAPQQDFELLLDRENGENPLYINSPYVPPNPFLT